MKIDPSKTFVTSDHHFGSSSLPFLHVFTPAQEEELVKKWNSIVKPDDLVLYNGDFCDGDEKCLADFKSKLNGHIVLVKGNHDRLPDDVYKEVFDDVVDEIMLEDLDIVMHHKPKESNVKQVYGHMHRGYVVGPLDKSMNFCSCVQAHDGYPVSMEDVIESFTQQTKQEDC